MAAPVPTYGFYADVHRGKLGADAFADALPEAAARVTAMTGDDIPERCETAWLHAVCAMAERVAGVGGAHRGISSEHVGGTSVTYTDEASAEDDVSAVAPWLAGTGLLYAGLCRCGGCCR